MSHSLASWKNLAWQGVGLLPDPVRHLGRRATGRLEVVDESEVDRRLDRAEELCAAGDDDALQAFLRRFELRPPDVPPDPFSADYAEAQWALYRRISGRSGYDVSHEASELDVDIAVRTPYPYSTGSARQVGDQLLARGFIIRALALEPGCRAVEFGPGWGSLTLDLATMGVEVTAVEIEPRFAEVIRRRVTRPGTLEVCRTDMLSFRPEGRYDAAIFFESFHHCGDHRGMLDRLRQVVTDEGLVAFAAEPVGWMPYPWGLRLDGMSLWSVRHHGWLELGFSRDYFAEALRRHGWRAERVANRSIGTLADVIIARRA